MVIVKDLPYTSQFTNSSLASAKLSLLTQFQDVQDIFEGSEQDRPGPLASPPSSTLLNSETSPYGCDESVSSIGRKLWGYQMEPGTSLEELVLECLPIPLRHHASRFLPWDDPDALLEHLAEDGLITHDMLSIFRGMGIERLDLSRTLAPDPVQISQINPRQVLKVFQLPHSFRHLSQLRLAEIPLKDEDVGCLSSLRLNSLDLSRTGISSEATAHLVIMKNFLENLNLENNPRVKHCASYNLACLVNLLYLNVQGTGLKMLSLRYIVHKFVSHNLPIARLDLKVPSGCRKYLEKVSDKYQVYIPDPYLRIETLKHLKDMHYANVRKNLEFHRARDSNVSLKGTVDEMAKRLKKLLKTRDADFRIKKWAKVA